MMIRTESLRRGSGLTTRAALSSTCWQLAREKVDTICGIRHLFSNFMPIFFTDDLTSASGGWIDFSTETDGYIEGLSLNVTEETGTLYYVTAYAINGAGDTRAQKPKSIEKPTL